MKKAILILSLTPGLGARKIKSLIEYFGDAEKVLAASTKELREVEGIGPRIIQALQENNASKKADEELARAKKLGIDIVALSDSSYPECLRQIYDPPPLIYVKGKLPETLNKGFDKVRSIAVVGTRNASEYALNFSRSLGEVLAKAGVIVVSGLALGIDGAAHQGTTKIKGGQTIAVLGSGVDVIYPYKHKALAEKIVVGGGAIISEYPIGTQPHAQNFPGRNRIICGLARGVVVVEGNKKSGAMITASYALEEGRTVFAVPGRAGDSRAAGVLDLLKQGAVLVESAQDVLNEFNWEEAIETDKSPLEDLQEPAKSIALLIKGKESSLLDDIVSATGKEAGEILPALTLLELKNIIKKLPSGRYISLL